MRNDPTTTKRRPAAKGRTILKTAVGVAALALAGTVVPATSASAAPVAARLTPEELQTICAGGTVAEGLLEGDCVFEVQGETLRTDWRQVGDQVSNCNAGTTSPIGRTVVATRSFSETWKAGGNAGLSLGPISIEGGGEYSETRTVSSETRDEITVNPGRKAALTAGAVTAVQTGRMRVEIREVQIAEWPSWTEYETQYLDEVTRDVPTGTIERGQDEVSCAEDFRVPA